MARFIDNLSRLDIACAIMTPVEIVQSDKDNLPAMCQSIHKQLFFATHGFDNGNQKSGFIADNKQSTLTEMCNDLEKSLQSDVELSDILSQFSYDFLQLQPFTYGNFFTLRHFLTTLARREIIKKPLDFRRLSHDDEDALLQNTINIATLRQIFASALDAEKKLHIYDHQDLWPEMDGSSITIGGEHFLVAMLDNIPSLVTINGGLVPINAIRDDLKQHLHTEEKQWFAVNKNKIIGAIYILNARTLDDIDLTADTIPLMHLDRDYSQLVTQKYIDKLVAANFHNKQPSKNPSFYMTMGGTGTGKSGLMSIAKEEIDDEDLIIASLDDSRILTNIYKLYLLTSHHNDDYQALSQFAKKVRIGILEYAIKHRYNLFFDGSGIEYQGRYDEFIARFKKAGYRTNILAASAPLYIEEDRTDISYPVIGRITKRLNKKNNPRGVPWEIVLRKHIGYAYSKFCAAMDWNVDRITVEDRGGDKKAQYILEELYICDYQILQQLINARKLGGQALLSEIRKHDMLPPTNAHSSNNLADTIDFKICNIRNDQARILVTIDKIRSLDGIQKAALNPQAIGEQDLLFNVHDFHIPAIDYPHDARTAEESDYPNRVRHITQKSSRRD